MAYMHTNQYDWVDDNLHAKLMYIIYVDISYVTNDYISIKTS